MTGGMPGGGMPGEPLGNLGQGNSSPWPLVPPAPPGGYSPFMLPAPPGSDSSPLLPLSPSVRQVAPGYSAAGAAQLLQYPSADQPMQRQRGEELLLGAAQQMAAVSTQMRQQLGEEPAAATAAMAAATQAEPQPPRLEPAQVDTKLWPGAHAAGWSVAMRSRQSSQSNPNPNPNPYPITLTLTLTLTLILTLTLTLNLNPNPIPIPNQAAQGPPRGSCASPAAWRRTPG